MTADELLYQLAVEGGAIVSSSECSEMELADARMHNRMYVAQDHLGYVRRPKKWLVQKVQEARDSVVFPPHSQYRDKLREMICEGETYADISNEGADALADYFIGLMEQIDGWRSENAAGLCVLCNEPVWEVADLAEYEKNGAHVKCAEKELTDDPITLCKCAIRYQGVAICPRCEKPYSSDGRAFAGRYA